MDELGGNLGGKNSSCQSFALAAGEILGNEVLEGGEIASTSSFPFVCTGRALGLHYGKVYFGYL